MSEFNRCDVVKLASLQGPRMLVTGITVNREGEQTGVELMYFNETTGHFEYKMVKGDLLVKVDPHKEVAAWMG